MAYEGASQRAFFGVSALLFAASAVVHSSAPSDLRDAERGALSLLTAGPARRNDTLGLWICPRRSRGHPNGSGATYRQSVRGCAIPDHCPASVGWWSDRGPAILWLALASWLYLSGFLIKREATINNCAQRHRYERTGGIAQ